jgi:hypothetical protein
VRQVGGLGFFAFLLSPLRCTLSLFLLSFSLSNVAFALEGRLDVNGE